MCDICKTSMKCCEAHDYVKKLQFGPKDIKNVGHTCTHTHTLDLLQTHTRVHPDRQTHTHTHAHTHTHTHTHTHLPQWRNTTEASCRDCFHTAQPVLGTCRCRHPGRLHLLDNNPTPLTSFICCASKTNRVRLIVTISGDKCGWHGRGGREVPIVTKGPRELVTCGAVHIDPGPPSADLWAGVASWSPTMLGSPPGKARVDVRGGGVVVAVNATCQVSPDVGRTT